ncbi:hypothetical protein H5410_044539 [Solanum commersonii]|uniref:Reverse transcriptase domain-containing protein n=1 Tax=Solanum commersonii TaxID=4109 RepID=A0A9J5X741_SOLCO|nr:hypothetical protein H5410_044539 [Solanum commersonii]
MSTTCSCLCQPRTWNMFCCFFGLSWVMPFSVRDALESWSPRDVEKAIKSMSMMIPDIKKAHDHVNWGFLMDLLEKMRFGRKWIQWIKFCISTVNFSVLINGSPAGKVGWLRGFEVARARRDSLKITHLQYADDTLIFCDLVSNMEILKKILGREVGALPTIYLGLPLGAKNVRKKLEQGGSSNISRGWKIDLDALPTYMMSLFPIPPGIINRLDRIRRKFLWQANKDRKKYSNENRSLWVRVITAKYEENDNWVTKEVTTYVVVGVERLFLIDPQLRRRRIKAG